MANRTCDLSHVLACLSDAPIAAKQLIVKMLSIKPEERPCSKECSHHPFLIQEDYQSFIVDEKIEQHIQQPVAFQTEESFNNIVINNLNYHDPRTIK